MKYIYTILLLVITVTVSAQEDLEKAFETERDSIQKLIELAADDETELNRLIDVMSKKEEAFQKGFTIQTNEKIASENSKIKSELDRIELQTIKKLDSIVKANDKELAANFSILEEAPKPKSELLLKFIEYNNQGNPNSWIIERIEKKDLEAIAKELNITIENSDTDQSALVDKIKKTLQS